MRPYYQDDAVTIYNGNCMEALAAQFEIDHLITDPPYTKRTHENARTNKGGQRGGKLEIDFPPLSPLDIVTLAETFHPKRWSVVFCELEMLGDYRRAAGENWVRSGFWRRPDGMPQVSGDRPGQPGEGLAIWHAAGRKRWNGGGHHAFWEHGIVRGPERVHETQKPEALMLDLIDAFTDEGETILDPFGGSGTTAVAAKRLGRRCIMFELQEKHCAAAVNRLRQGSLFSPVQELLL